MAFKGKSSVEVKGDYKQLVSDIGRFAGKAEEISSYEFGQMTNRLADFWARRYNSYMRRHPSLAKARIARKTQGRSYINYISIPNHAVNFDMGRGKMDKGHYVSLYNSAPLRRWVRNKWNYTPFGWEATQSVSDKSKVWGSAANPRGQVFVKSHYAKFGWSIIEQAHKDTKEQSSVEMRAVLPKMMRKIRSNCFSRGVYNIRVNINL